MRQDTDNHATNQTHAPVVVDTPEALDKLVAALRTQPVIAVDTESNSLYAYREQVCLIQISIPGVDYLVDPLALDSLEALSSLFESEDIEKIFHAADYDLMVLKRDFDFDVRNIFDTMWAARILGWPKVGLADILAHHFDVEVNKRYQRYDWGKRPLDPKALTYAWMDSHYLLALREIQKEALIESGRWKEAQEVFTYLAMTVDVPPEDLSERHFWRIKGIQGLRSHDLSVLYQLYLWRELVAERLDRPPVKVLSNGRLMRLAKVQPRSRDELIAAGLTPGQVRRFGSGILKALHSKPLPEPPAQPRSRRLPDHVVDRFKTLKAWRKEVAQGRGVDSDVILPNAVLWELAKNPPEHMEDLLTVPGIGPWRQNAYGPDLLQLVAD